MTDFNNIKKSIKENAEEARDTMDRLKNKGAKGGIQEFKDKFNKNKNKSGRNKS